jgi:N-acetylglucosamine-6-sulfatase
MVFVAHKALHPNIKQRNDGSPAALEGQRPGFIPAERHAGRYARHPEPRRENALSAPSGKPALARTIPGLPPLSPATGTPETDIRARLEMLLGVDESVARIVETLRVMGQLDKTIIVFTSDHGYFYGEHGLNEERRLAYEETARVPLVVRYPRGVRAGGTASHLVQLTDIAPTILELASVTDTVKRDGRSLGAPLHGTVVPWRTSILIEYYTDQVFPRTLTMEYQAVRTDRYKYINYVELQGMDELYDLRADPFELTNLLGSPPGDSLAVGLRAELAKLQRETGYRRDFRGYR